MPPKAQKLCSFFVLLFLTGGYLPVFALKPVVDELSRNPIKIIENKGQWEDPVLFKASIPGGTLFITKGSLVYTMLDENALFETWHNRRPVPVIKGHHFKVSFEGANSEPQIITRQRSSEYYNYFIGNNPAKWKSQCYAFGKVTLRNLYNGIDLEIVALDKRIKLNFIVQPFANPNEIQLVYEGMDKLEIVQKGLAIQTSVCTVRESEPVSFQPDISDQPIPTAFVLTDNKISFKTALFNPTYPLLIDPELIFGTYSGSRADNWGYTATFDTSGNAYSGGTVHNNQPYPVTMGAFQTAWAGGVGGPFARDAGILKYTPDGKNLVWCSYIGGSSNEGPHSMVTDIAGNLYVMGATWSTDFPVTTGAFDQSHNGESDIYVSKLSPDGMFLLASTFVGGSKHDGLNGEISAIPSGEFYDPFSRPLAYNYGDYFRGEIILDINGFPHVVSSTFSKASDGFPVVNAFQAIHGGQEDGCVFKLNPSLSVMQFSTFVGGSGFDAAYGIALDEFNTLYICGGTTSTNLGPSSGPFAHHGNVDAFVARISSTGALVKLICYGTNKYDQAYLIQMDNNYNVYITGQTEGNMPSKGNVATNDFTKQFITSFNRNLDSVRISANFGVTGEAFPSLSPSAFLVDICNRVYFSGWGGKVNFQNFNPDLGSTTGLYTTNDAFQKTTDGSDFYLVVFSPNLGVIEYASFLGSKTANDHVDGGTSRFDKHGQVYQSVCGGCGGVSDFPTTPGAWSRINNSSNCNNAMIKMNLTTTGIVPIIKDTLLFGRSFSDTLLYTFPNDTFLFSVDLKDPSNLTINTSFNGSLLAQFPNFANVTNTVITPSHNRIRINWPVLCTNVGDTVVLNMVTTNNNCPVPRSNTSRIRIVVKPLPEILPPYPECVLHLNDSTVKMKWGIDSVSASNLKSYQIYRRKESGSFGIIKILNSRDSVWYDSTAIDHLHINYCYYFISRDQCDGVSLPSRIICSQYREDTATIAGFRYNPDTIVYLNAFDTLSFADSISLLDSGDSLYLRFSGSLLATGKVENLNVNTTSGKARYSFNWRAGCEDITTNDTLSLQVFAFDNQCPTPRSVTAVVQVVVFPPPLHSTPSVQCIRKPGGDEVQIRWGKIPTNKYFSHYILLRKAPNGIITKIAEIHGDTSISLTTTVPNHETQNYCFAIAPVNVCGTHGDTSSYQCTVRKESEYPPNLPIYTVTVEENKHLLIRWQRSAEQTFLGYNVYRSHLDGSREIRIKSLMTDSVLTDDAVDVMKQSYCYKIRQVNDCGIENKTPGDEACSMVLKGVSNPFEHSLNWNPYVYWKAGTKQFAVIRQEPDMEPIEVAQTGPLAILYTDDQLNIDNGLYHYTIRADENDGGYGYSSLSNTIELIQKPIVYTPNVFTPNNDQVNDRWEPHPVFVKEYNLKIFNRWGQLVFETNDKHETFNAEFYKDPTAVDAYVYLITYTGWDNSMHNQTGNVTVLR